MTQPDNATDAITDVLGIEVGHFTDTRRPTGCSVVITRDGAVAGVDVRGAAPGTRETDLLHPSNLVDRVHAILLAGGSAWGLDAASGVMRWLEEHGIGLQVPYGLVPIVPAAVLFDLPLGDARIRPDAQAGYAACQAAGRMRPSQGNVGAGAGALVGKLFGIARAMKGGIGTASITLDGTTVGALVACNALGDVVDPATGDVIAGARTPDGAALLNIRQAILAGDQPNPLLAGTNTTLAVLATDAVWYVQEFPNLYWQDFQYLMAADRDKFAAVLQIFRGALQREWLAFTIIDRLGEFLMKFAEADRGGPVFPVAMEAMFEIALKHERYEISKQIHRLLESFNAADLRINQCRDVFLRQENATQWFLAKPGRRQKLKSQPIGRALPVEARQLRARR